MEVVIASAILAVAMMTILGALLSTERHVREASARQRAVEQCRRVADVLARELRDANFTAADFEPDAPFEDTSVEFRKVVGWDPTTGVALSPTRASATFRRIALSGTTVSMDMPGVTLFTLAEGVSDLRFTFTPPNLLTIRVQVEATDGQGGTARETAEVSVALKNQLP